MTKKAERLIIDALELWCCRRLLRVPWTARRSNQSILREINPEYSLKGLMLKLQYFGHLMWKTDSLEKTLMLGKIEGRTRGWQRMRWLDGMCMLSVCIMNAEVDLDHLAKVVLFRVLHCRGTLSPLFSCTFRKEVSVLSPQLRNRKLCLRWSIYTNYLEFFFTEFCLFSFIYLWIKLFTSEELMGFYFIFWVIL